MNKSDTPKNDHTPSVGRIVLQGFTYFFWLNAVTTLGLLFTFAEIIQHRNTIGVELEDGVLFWIRLSIIPLVLSVLIAVMLELIYRTKETAVVSGGARIIQILFVVWTSILLLGVVVATAGVSVAVAGMPTGDAVTAGVVAGGLVSFVLVSILTMRILQLPRALFSRGALSTTLMLLVGFVAIWYAGIVLAL